MRKLIVVVATGAILAAGCGSSKTSSSTSTTAAAPPVSLAGPVNDHGTKTLSGTDLTLETDDIYFNPTFVKAGASAKVKVTVKNEGKAAHTFTIDSLKIDESVAPGTSKTVDVTLPSSGSLTYYCRFHQSGGMQGAFVIT
jgi:plastocyanin